MRGMRAIPMILLCWAGLIAAGDLEPIDRHAMAILRVAGAPRSLAADRDDVWVTNAGRLDKFAAGDAMPLLSVPNEGGCGVPAVGFNAVWLADCHGRGIHRISRFDGSRVAAIDAGGTTAIQLATGAGSVWALDEMRGVLLRIDPRTNGVAARIDVAVGARSAAFGFDSVWVLSPRANSVLRVDPRLNRVVATIPAGPAPGSLAAGEQAVWALNHGDGTVTRVDPMLNAPTATIEVTAPGSGSSIDAGGGRVWVRGTDPLLSVIDPRLNRVTARYGPADQGGAVRVAGGAVWVTSPHDGTIWILPAPEREN